MPIYTCEKCARTFKQKSGYDDHQTKKNDCIKNTMIHTIIEKKVQEALSKTNEGVVKIDTTATTIMQSNTIDYSKKTRDELIAICKEKSIKGYSGKNKDDIVKLLTPSLNYVNGNTGTTPEIIRYIDLFCGLGAFHTAFNSSKKFNCVLACDIDEGIRNIYKSNYGIDPVNDIRTINVDTMPDFDLLCAGFPCQPFSIAGNGEGFKDKEKGNLFYDILKIIDAKTPRMCILENVKNLKTHDNGNTYKAIETELLKRNYIITSKIINSAEYGSPQARQRIFIVATKDKPFVIPMPVKITNPVSTIIDTTNVKDELNRTRYTLKEKTIKTKIDISKPHILYDVYPVLSPEKKKIIRRSKKKNRKNRR